MRRVSKGLVCNVSSLLSPKAGPALVCFFSAY
jgi:hypothetical protein